MKTHPVSSKEGYSEMQKEFTGKISISYLTSHKEPEINLY